MKKFIFLIPFLTVLLTQDYSLEFDGQNDYVIVHHQLNQDFIALPNNSATYETWFSTYDKDKFQIILLLWGSYNGFFSINEGKLNFHQEDL